MLIKLYKYKLYANLKKYEFRIDYLNFLRFVVGREGVIID